MEVKVNKVIVEPASGQTKEELVAQYKVILKEYIDRRPSGTRLKIAKALEKNKSFVSQITNPTYTIPVPARHLNTIFDICRFSVKERETFLKIYTAAHPSYQYRIESDHPNTSSRHRQLSIEVPVLDNRDLQNKIETMIKDYAEQLFSLVEKK